MPPHRRTHKRRSSSRSRRTLRRTRIYKQKAGGDWQSFCAACGKPLSNWALDREPYNKPVEETAWMNRNVGYDATNTLILELGADDMLGAAPILDDQGDEETDEALEYMATEEGGNFDVSEFHIQGDDVDYDPERQLGGIVIHKACKRQLERSGMRVTFDLIQKLNAGCAANKQYQGQEYDWEEALAANPNHHKSPLKSKSAKHELLFGCARDVPEMMAATEVREEMARRRRVVNVKRFANVTRKMNDPAAFMNNNASRPITNAVKRLPLAIKTQIGSYLAAPENIKAGNRVAPGNIVEYNAGAGAGADADTDGGEAAAAPLGGAGNGKAPPAAFENVD